MRRFTKINSKKGFTLLEVLLATCILVIVSSMLMEVFITTMGFSYNSSVYSRSAAWNSKLCVTQLAEWSNKADRQVYDSAQSKFVDSTEPAYYAIAAYSSSTKNVTFTQAAAGSKLGEVKVIIHSEKGVSAPNAINLDNNRFSAESINQTDKYADNRYIMFYYPGYNAESKSYKGDTHMYMLDGHKCWGHKRGSKIYFDQWAEENFESSVAAEYIDGSN